MSDAGEVEAPAVEQQQMTEAPSAVAEKPQEKEKAVKEKRQKAPKGKKPRNPKAASHPPYFQMIQEAITALNEKSGSSSYAIAKYIEEKHTTVLPVNFRKILGLQLKNSATRGKLIKIKASYKLPEAGNKEKVTTKAARANAGRPRETRQRKSVKEIESTTNKAVTAKPKAAARRMRKSASAKPKQPKSIKSTATKKTKKAAV
ncbi:hypothetical protein Nepgr_008372 [Nepenthes gracilis]|uniref:H15 domain-containing protein n=1 Tax=Nepenthes gracilis TaxID=150966 RepID=A0AAD3S8M2_NEPGR|nr:hypothetical protein Nepgr_008372 [Nepenthes gracilis]